MKTPILTGLGAGAICALLHYFEITGNGSMGAFFHYSPLIVFFAAIYYSIKRTSAEKSDGEIHFKQALKYGGATAAIMAVLIGIGFFIGLTHYDVRGDVDYMISQKATHEQIKQQLAYVTRQNMFDRAKFFALPYFLLGFLMTVGVAFVLKRRQVTNK